MMLDLLKLKDDFENYLWPQRRALLPIGYFFLLLGLLSVYSSTMTLVSHPLRYIQRQSLFCISGFLVYSVGYILGYRKWIFKIDFVWFMSIALLLLPLTPLGLAVNGARRWIHYAGFSFQTSELVKILWIVILCDFVIKAHLDVQKNFFASKPLWLKLFLILFLLLIQPDFGTAFLLTTLTLMVLFIARVRLDFYFAMILTAILLIIFAIILAPYRMRRFAAFLDPWIFAQDQGYQLIQSLIAIGSGSFLGVGIGKGLQKHQALPEAHTDFIFAVIVEETGLLGGIIVIVLFLWFILILLSRGYYLAKKEYYRECYFYIAAAILFFLQTVINLGVCVGLLPTKGLTLPFFSYGGSSLWMVMFLMGILDGSWKKNVA
jgi:cell division protein FtsW